MTPELAEQAGRDLDTASAHDILEWAVSTFKDRIAVATNLQDAVLVDLASSIRPGIDVLFLDTGYHFAETIGMRDAVEAAHPVRMLTLTPTRTVAEQDAEFGERLYERRPDQCCAMRKVEPLRESLAGYDAWVTGMRRDEAATRASTPVVAWDATFNLVKINPLATWTQDDMDAYAAERGLLTNPLIADGYPSIGCAPCTRKVAPGEHPRAGRWAGLAKTECGLHEPTTTGGTA